MLLRRASRAAGRVVRRRVAPAPRILTVRAPPASRLSTAHVSDTATVEEVTAFRTRTVKRAEAMAGEDSGRIAAVTRPNAGPNAAEFLRANGRVPGVLYGKGGPRVLLHVDARELERRVRQHGDFFNRVFELDVAGSAEPVRVIPVALTRHPGTDVPENVTFLHWRDGSAYRLYVPLRYEGTDDCPGMRQGGLLLQQRRRLPVTFRGRAEDIPSHFSVDMIGKPGGHVTRVRHITLPPTCSCKLKPDDTLSVVSSTRGGD